MARTESVMLPLQTPAPDFALPDVTTGAIVTLADFADRDALLVIFICRHCPFVKHIEAGLAQLARDYAQKPLGIAAISSNDIASYPEDAPEGMREQAAATGFIFPYLFDETQEVARSYGAACTPDPFLFDRERKLAYRGQLDGSRPGNDIPVTCKDMRDAIDAVLAGKAVSAEQRPSLGCNIKWK
ncbi:MAG TPA: thioredoxin family protein [Acidisarcina sp.]|nr:thioredoxin family protein [Acidisarcina sp.]